MSFWLSLALGGPSGGHHAKPVDPPSAVFRGTVTDASGVGKVFTPAFRAWLREHKTDLAQLAEQGRVFRPWEHQLVTVEVAEVLVDRTDRELAVGQLVTVYVPDPHAGVVSSDALLYVDPYVGAWEETVPPFTEASSSFVLARGEAHPLRQEAAWSASFGTGSCKQGCTWQEMLTDVRSRLTVQ